MSHINRGNVLQAKSSLPEDLSDPKTGGGLPVAVPGEQAEPLAGCWLCRIPAISFSSDR